MVVGDMVGDISRDIVVGDMLRATSEQGHGSGRCSGGHRQGQGHGGTHQSRDTVAGDVPEKGCSGGGPWWQWVTVTQWGTQGTEREKWGEGWGTGYQDG